MHSALFGEKSSSSSSSSGSEARGAYDIEKGIKVRVTRGCVPYNFPAP